MVKEKILSENYTEADILEAEIGAARQPGALYDDGHGLNDGLHGGSAGADASRRRSYTRR